MGSFLSNVRRFAFSISFRRDMFLFSSLYAVLFARVTRCFFDIDTAKYTDVADQMFSGTFFSKASGALLSSLVVPPGYPAFLALGKLFSSHPCTGILGIQFLAGWACLLLSIYCGGALAGTFPVGVTVLAVLWWKSAWVVSVLPEWLPFVAVILCYSALASFIKEKRVGAHVLHGVLVSIAVLIKPMLMPMLVVPVMAALLVRRSAVLCVVSISPVLLWMTFNLWHLGSFAIVPGRGGFDFFSTEAMFGGAPVREDDDAALREFIRRFDRERPPVLSDSQLDNLYADGNQDYEAQWHAMELGFRIMEEMKVAPAEQGRILMTCAKRIIQANPFHYARLVYSGFCREFPGLLAGLLGMLCAVLLLRRGLACPFAWTTIAATAVHFAVQSVVLIIQIVYGRYMEMTLIPMLVVMVLMVAAAVRGEEGEAR